MCFIIIKIMREIREIWGNMGTPYLFACFLLSPGFPWIGIQGAVCAKL
jgi:hypothetical protein